MLRRFQSRIRHFPHRLSDEALDRRAVALTNELHADVRQIPKDELTRLVARMKVFCRKRNYPKDYTHAWLKHHAERLYLTFQWLEELLASLPSGDDLICLECGAPSIVTDFLIEDFPQVTWRSIDQDIREPWAIEEQSIDLILCTEVLEHLSDPPEGFQVQFVKTGLKRTLLQVHRALKPGGLFFATTPNVASVYHLMVNCQGFSPWLCPPHVREYSMHELRHELTEAGLELVKWRAIHCMTLPYGFDYTPIFRYLVAQGHPTDNRGDDHFICARRPSMTSWSPRGARTESAARSARQFKYHKQGTSPLLPHFP
jgi:SAM-dependent methyltransferase